MKKTLGYVWRTIWITPLLLVGLVFVLIAFIGWGRAAGEITCGFTELFE